MDEFFQLRKLGLGPVDMVDIPPNSTGESVHTSLSLDQKFGEVTENMIVAQSPYATMRNGKGLNFSCDVVKSGNGVILLLSPLILLALWKSKCGSLAAEVNWIGRQGVFFSSSCRRDGEF